MRLAGPGLVAVVGLVGVVGLAAQGQKDQTREREREDGGPWEVWAGGGEPGPAPDPALALFLYRFLSCIYMTLKSSERYKKKSSPARHVYVSHSVL